MWLLLLFGSVGDILGLGHLLGISWQKEAGVIRLLLLPINAIAIALQ